jgi:hypothetical protein
MIGTPRTPSKPTLILLALLGVSLSGAGASAETRIVIKNNGSTEAQIGFDSTPAIKIAPGDVARLALNDGEHTIQCRFEGNYDGCNIADRFTVAGARESTFVLAPVLDLAHAVALAGQGMLSMETRQDGGWATTTLDVAGAPDECADYSKGRLASVSHVLRGGLAIRNPALATQTLCGEQRPVIGAIVNGAQSYVLVRFVTFKDNKGHSVLIRQ